MDIFNVDRKDNNINKSKNNNISQDTSYKSYIKNDSPNQSTKKIIIKNRQAGDTSSSSQAQKKLENFEINLLQTQRKKEYENFLQQQNYKINSLKENWKQLELVLNKIDNELEENKNKEKKNYK